MSDLGGVWRTVGGRRIFIKDGEDLATAMKNSGKFGNKEEQKQEEPKGFENSKIRDKNGNLMKVYHGTTTDFKEFDEKFIRQRKDGTKGFYFATEQRKDSVAGYYAGEKGIIKEAYLNIQKPLYIQTNDKETLTSLIKSGEIKNYDGIIRTSSGDLPESKYYNYRTKSLETEKVKKGDIVEIIVFKKEQIKILK